ncbi:hypothetical protein NUITMVS3_33010 [Shewanella xiamenensis]|nr:hypothetical protein NUITMVS2_45080 [Shewanella xiamenensis]GLD78867.1 hypothetical protein NUITMVS3_33010 [Shewanella xiamenensis]
MLGWLARYLTTALTCNTLKTFEVKNMSQHDYTLVANTRLIDLPALPVGLVEQWLSLKDEWTQKQFRRFLR